MSSLCALLHKFSMCFSSNPCIFWQYVGMLYADTFHVIGRFTQRRGSKNGLLTGAASSSFNTETQNTHLPPSALPLRNEPDRRGLCLASKGTIGSLDP